MNQKFPFTPGPWTRVHGVDGRTTHIVDAKGRTVCTMSSPFGIPFEENEANARLICQAGDLLVSVLELLQQVHTPTATMDTNPEDPFPLPAYQISAKKTVDSAVKS